MRKRIGMRVQSQILVTGNILNKQRLLMEAESKQQIPLMYEESIIRQFSASRRFGLPPFQSRFSPDQYSGLDQENTLTNLIAYDSEYVSSPKSPKEDPDYYHDNTLKKEEDLDSQESEDLLSSFILKFIDITDFKIRLAWRKSFQSIYFYANTNSKPIPLQYSISESSVKDGKIFDSKKDLLSDCKSEISSLKKFSCLTFNNSEDVQKCMNHQIKNNQAKIQIANFQQIRINFNSHSLRNVLKEEHPLKCQKGQEKQGKPFMAIKNDEISEENQSQHDFEEIEIPFFPNFRRQESEIRDFIDVRDTKASMSIIRPVSMAKNEYLSPKSQTMNMRPVSYCLNQNEASSSLSKQKAPGRPLTPKIIKENKLSPRPVISPGSTQISQISNNPSSLKIGNYKGIKVKITYNQNPTRCQSENKKGQSTLSLHSPMRQAPQQFKEKQPAEFVRIVRNQYYGENQHQRQAHHFQRQPKPLYNHRSAPTSPMLMRGNPHFSQNFILPSSSKQHPSVKKTETLQKVSSPRIESTKGISNLDKQRRVGSNIPNLDGKAFDHLKAESKVKKINQPNNHQHPSFSYLQVTQKSPAMKKDSQNNFFRSPTEKQRLNHESEYFESKPIRKKIAIISTRNNIMKNVNI